MDFGYPSSKSITCCFCNNSKREFVYGNEEGQIFSFDLEQKSELLLHKPDPHDRDVAPIKMIYVTKPGSLLFIQSDRVFIQDKKYQQDRSDNYKDLKLKPLCMCQEDRSIYIPRNLNEFQRYSINEDTNTFVETSYLQVSKEQREQLMNLDTEKVVSKMESDKVLSLPMFRKVVQRRLESSQKAHKRY